jgi:acyl carrier protein
MRTLQQQIRQIAAKEFDIPGYRITPSARFQNLGVGSCEIVGLLIALEEKFKIEFPFDKVDELDSLASITALILSLPKSSGCLEYPRAGIPEERQQPLC